MLDNILYFFLGIIMAYLIQTYIINKQIVIVNSNIYKNKCINLV
jgi:hypothetical protein